MSAVPNLITQAAYARHRGVSKNSVYAAVQTGRIALVGGLVDADRADRDWDANTDRDKPKGANGKGPQYGPYSPTRKALEELRLERERFEFERDRGEWVKASEAEARYTDLARAARNELLAIAPRLGRVLAPINDPAECERRLRAELERACNEMAGE